MNREHRRAGWAKPGHEARDGCPHVLAQWATVHDRTSKLVRPTYPCEEPKGHDKSSDGVDGTPHRTVGGKQWC